MNANSKNGDVRIGFYICHCGSNIAATVDCPAVAQYVAGLTGVVVSRDYKYMCSDPGQQIIQQDIREQQLNRVVVASCSPLLHEHTFRNATAAAGLNPFYFQMVNIREHDSWVHTDQEAATAKAKALAHAAIRRVRFHKALEPTKVPIHPDTLVLGGGIAGIHAALLLANAGKKVTLVERGPSIGGHMAQLDKTFPTLDCSACILTPKMTSVRGHPNIRLMAYSEVDKVEGYVGNFKVKVREKTRYVRTDRCTGCDACTTVCPVEVPSEFNLGLNQRKAIYRPFPQAVPYTFTINRRGLPPCQAACSLHQNAQGYITLIAQGKCKEARDVILRDNPLPSICGRICTHPCMLACSRAKVDDPLNIPGLKRFVLDFVGTDYHLPKPASERPEKIAVVGAGPAGLMCAYELRQRGYQPVVYEALPMAGGMLTVGIPKFRLPRDVIATEVAKFAEIGIKFRFNTRVGKDITLEELRAQHAAVFLGIGAHVERKLGVPGEDQQNVCGGLEFLWRVNLSGPTPLGGRVLVIGGGNSAIDAARTALRCGAKEVRIVYRRTRAEMPADPAEISAAEEEGVRIDYLAAPTRFVGEGGKITAVECLRMQLGDPDASGRRAPVPIRGSEFTTECDAVINTIGQSPDVAALSAEPGLAHATDTMVFAAQPDAATLGVKPGLKLTRWGTLKADAVTLQTNLENVFVGGDCFTGPDVVVNAMAGGKKAAISIDRYLNGQDLHCDRELEGSYKATFEVDTTGVMMRRQVQMTSIPIERRRSFDEVHIGYTEELAQAEAKRCLDCAVCCDCRLCATACEAKAIDYWMKDEVHEVPVGNIIVATGFKLFDATRIPQYGYGLYPNVVTSIELERLVTSSGPTGGEVILRNGRKPKSVGFILCVGSRDMKTNRWCSRTCCMHSMKLAQLVREHTDADVTIFYLDLRAPGKGCEEFYDKSLKEGIQFVRGRVAEVTDWALAPEEEGKLVIRVEDTLAGFVRRIPVDMIVLAVGMEPQTDAQDVRRLLNMSCGAEGWFLERHPKLAPVATFTDGIFIAGCCQGPKDIPDSIAQAGAAAAEALALIDKGYIEQEPNTAHILEDDCSGCKSCIPLCPFIAISFDEARQKAVINEAMCKGCGTCVASCPSGSIRQNLFEDEEVFSEIEGVLSYA